MVTWRGLARTRLYRTFPYPLGLAILLVQIAIGIVLFAVFQEFVPSELGASDAWPGYMIAAYGAARFLSETPTGAITDRIERKIGLLIGFGFMVPAVLLMALVQEKLAYLGFAALLGWGTAFVWPATYAISADLYAPERRGKVVGFLNVAQFLGFGAGALTGALLIEWSPAVVFGIACGAVVTAFASAQLGIPAYRDSDRMLAVARVRPPVRAVLSWRLAVLSGLILGATVATSMIVPAIRPYGARVLEISFAKLTVLLVPSVVVGAALYIPAGHLGDRFGRMRPFVAGQVLISSGAFVIASTETVGIAAAGATLVVVGNVLMVPAWNAAVMDLAPESYRGALIGWSVALSGLGLAAGPAVGGYVVGAHGPPTAFRAAAIVAGTTGIVALLYGRLTRGARQPMVERVEGEGEAVSEPLRPRR